jgi:hypothetical protein
LSGWRTFGNSTPRARLVLIHPRSTAFAKAALNGTHTAVRPAGLKPFPRTLRPSACFAVPSTSWLIHASISGRRIEMRVRCDQVGTAGCCRSDNEPTITPSNLNAGPANPRGPVRRCPPTSGRRSPVARLRTRPLPSLIAFAQVLPYAEGRKTIRDSKGPEPCWNDFDLTIKSQW